MWKGKERKRTQEGEERRGREARRDKMEGKELESGAVLTGPHAHRTMHSSHYADPSLVLTYSQWETMGRFWIFPLSFVFQDLLLMRFKIYFYTPGNTALLPYERTLPPEQGRKGIASPPKQNPTSSWLQSL